MIVSLQDKGATNLVFIHRTALDNSSLRFAINESRLSIVLTTTMSPRIISGLYNSHDEPHMPFVVCVIVMTNVTRYLYLFLVIM